MSDTCFLYEKWIISFSSETEKYAHVTFFFNGGKEKQVEGEDRCMVPSPKVATYDLKPEMNADGVAAKVGPVQRVVMSFFVLSKFECKYRSSFQLAIE